MLSQQKIKKTINSLKGAINSNDQPSLDDILELVSLAEKYISLEVMPERRPLINDYNLLRTESGTIDAIRTNEIISLRNETIEECTLIATKLLAEKDEAIERLKELYRQEVAKSNEKSIKMQELEDVKDAETQSLKDRLEQLVLDKDKLQYLIELSYKKKTKN